MIASDSGSALWTTLPPLDRGDIVLLPFPFSEGEATRQRPALVLSGRAYHESCADCIVAMITGRVDAAPRPGDHLISHWREAGLLRPSLARAKLTTISRRRVRKRLGALRSEDLEQFTRGLAGVLGWPA